MSTSIASILGHNLRRIREERGLSISQLASRSGVSKGTLSKIESATTNATVDTLDALARTLDVPAGDLLTAGERPDVVVVRADEGMPFGDTAMPDARLISTLARSGLQVEVHDMTIGAGRSVSSTTHGVGSWEHVLVLEGSVRLGPVDSLVDASAGDYVAYPADRPHAWSASGATAARMWVTLVSPHS